MLDSFPYTLTRVGVALLLGVAGLRADGTGPYSAQSLVPAIDSWMYTHAGSPGSRETASIFSALPNDGVGSDDRLAQFILKFDTVAAGVPAGLGTENYDPSQVKLTCVVATGNSFVYDPTEDPRATYGPTVSAAPDTDPGRPIEVFGTGFRGAFTATNFTEGSPYGSSAVGARNAYALGFSEAGVARDVTNNVTQAVDSLPWAEAKILVDLAEDGNYTELSPGALVPMYAHVVFELNLAKPGVADYVRNSFNQGFLWLTVSSLHPATLMGASGFPAFFTKENQEQVLFGDVAASLDVKYSLPLRIASFTRDTAVGSHSLVWNGSPGYQYQIQGTEDLNSGPWTTLANFTTPVPAPLTWNGSSSATHAFFRVIRSTQP